MCRKNENRKWRSVTFYKRQKLKETKFDPIIVNRKKFFTIKSMFLSKIVKFDHSKEFYTLGRTFCKNVICHLANSSNLTHFYTQLKVGKRFYSHKKIIWMLYGS